MIIIAVGYFDHFAFFFCHDMRTSQSRRASNNSYVNRSCVTHMYHV